MKKEEEEKKVRRDPSTERRRLLHESPSDLVARDERNRQFFRTTGANDVATAMTRQANQHSPDTKDEQEEVDLKNGIDKLEGSYQDNNYPPAPEWDDQSESDLPQEHPVHPLYCRFCLKTPCVFLQYQDELERVVEIMYPEETNKVKRYHMYRRMSRELHGPLGKGCRKPLPKCFVQGFRELYPDEDGKYTGFHYVGNDDGSQVN